MRIYRDFVKWDRLSDNKEEVVSCRISLKKNSVIKD